MLFSYGLRRLVDRTVRVICDDFSPHTQQQVRRKVADRSEKKGAVLSLSSHTGDRVPT